SNQRGVEPLTTRDASRYRPAFGRFGLGWSPSRFAASSSESPRFSSGWPRWAWSTSDRFSSFLGSPRYRDWCFPAPVGGWFLRLRLLLTISTSDSKTNSRDGGMKVAARRRAPAPRQQARRPRGGLHVSRRPAAAGAAGGRGAFWPG